MHNTLQPHGLFALANLLLFVVVSLVSVY